VVIRGNHDVELYWESAQRALVEALSSRSELPEDDRAAHQAFEQRIEFRHWFYYERDLLYVEHGHQYDASCAYQHQLAPLSPGDPDLISYSFADILLRYVVQPTRELSPEGHDANGLGTYLRLLVSLGVGGGARLCYRFLRAFGRMLSTWREHVSEHAAQLRAEHESRMLQLGSMFGIDVDNLREITQLWATPVTSRLRTIFRTVFLDGLALGLCAAVAITLLGVSGTISWVVLSGLFALVSLVMYLYIKGARVLGPHAALQSRACKLVELMPARFVVMGHTHKPFMGPLSSKSTYVNLGYWTIDWLDRRAPKPPCSHLVIRHDESGRPEATLFAWDGEEGASVLYRDPVQDTPHAYDPIELEASGLLGDAGELQIEAAEPGQLT
jgi:hypothetical protein